MDASGRLSKTEQFVVRLAEAENYSHLLPNVEDFVLHLRGLRGHRARTAVKVAQSVGLQRGPLWAACYNAMHAQGIEQSQIVSQFCRTAADPGRFLERYLALGGELNDSVKAGLATAARRLYNEESVIRHSEYWMPDIVRRVNPDPRGATQKALFSYLDGRNETDFPRIDYRLLPKLSELQSLRRLPMEARASIPVETLQHIGLPWADAVRLMPGTLDQAKYELLAPLMTDMEILGHFNLMVNGDITNDGWSYLMRRLEEWDSDIPIHKVWAVYRKCNHHPSLPMLSNLLDRAAKCTPPLDDTLIVIDCSWDTRKPYRVDSPVTIEEVALLEGISRWLGSVGTDLILVNGESTLFVPKDGVVPSLARAHDAVVSGTYDTNVIGLHFDRKRHKRVMVYTTDPSHRQFQPSHVWVPFVHHYLFDGGIGIHVEPGKFIDAHGVDEAHFETIAWLLALDG